MDKGLIVHALLFNSKGEALFIRRSPSEDVLPGAWDIPGGTLEDGEDPKIGAIRETKEETGIDITDLSLFTFTSNVDTSKNKQFVRLIFIGRADDSIHITLNPEDHDAYQWIPINDVPNNIQLVDYLYAVTKSIDTKNHELLTFDRVQIN